MLRAAHFALNLPDQGADKKRFMQKDLIGRGYDNKYGVNETPVSPRSRNTLRAGNRTHEASACSIRNNNEISQRGHREGDNSDLRRSIQTHTRMLPLQGGFRDDPMHRTHYSKATIAERFANKGIRNRT